MFNMKMPKQKKNIVTHNIYPKYLLNFRGKHYSSAKSCLQIYERQTLSIANLAWIQMQSDLYDHREIAKNAYVILSVFLIRSSRNYLQSHGHYIVHFPAVYTLLTIEDAIIIAQIAAARHIFVIYAHMLMLNQRA